LARLNDGSWPMKCGVAALKNRANHGNPLELVD